MGGSIHTSIITSSDCAFRRRSTLFTLLFILLFAIFLPIDAFWVPPFYWATVYRNGQLEIGKSQRELLTFPPLKDAFIGYWINDTNEHHEAYGHVFLNSDPRQPDAANQRYCGYFADSWANVSRRLCGGFRILAYKSGTQGLGQNPFEFVHSSVANPFVAVEYLDTQIARIQLGDGRKVYGGAKMAARVAFAAGTDKDGMPLFNISYAGDHRKYVQRVEILQRSTAFPPEDLLNDSAFPPIPVRPVPVPVPMNTPSTIAATTTTEPNVQEETTATASAPGEEEMQLAVEESITADPLPTEILPPTVTPSEIDLTVNDDYDDGLSGAGIEWGALFTGDGVEEREEGRQRRLSKPRDRRRRHHFRHRHPSLHSILINN